MNRHDGMRLNPLSRSFYSIDTTQVAQALLGKYLVRKQTEGTQIGRIIEVEAYLGPHDLAAHSRYGITPRTRVMFGPPGYAYVYLIYGIYHCLNVVTEPEGHGAAVLIRALEPIQGISGRTSGPGLLCKALDITRALNGYDLTHEDFHIAENLTEPPVEIIASKRIGIAYAGEWANKLLRFSICGSQPFSE